MGRCNIELVEILAQQNKALSLIYDLLPLEFDEETVFCDDEGIHVDYEKVGEVDKKCATIEECLGRADLLIREVMSYRKPEGVDNG